MRVVEFHRVFSAAHRLWNDDSPCQNVHGHNFEVDVRIECRNEALTESGFAVPFASVKTQIDALDHALILDVDDPMLVGFRQTGIRVYEVNGPPSTERMAEHLARQVAGVTNAKNPGLDALVTVLLRETAGIAASASADTLAVW